MATWRVALYVAFLRRTAGLSFSAVVVSTLLPLTIIVVALTALNLEHVVFEIMGGIRDVDKSVNDGAYTVVVVLSLLSVFLAPVVAIAYAILVYLARRGAKPAVHADAAAPRRST